MWDGNQLSFNSTLPFLYSWRSRSKKWASLFRVWNEHHYFRFSHIGRGKGTVLLIVQPKSWLEVSYENVRVFSNSPRKIICNHFGHLYSVKNCITLPTKATKRVSDFLAPQINNTPPPFPRTSRSRSTLIHEIDIFEKGLKSCNVICDALPFIFNLRNDTFVSRTLLRSLYFYFTHPSPTYYGSASLTELGRYQRYWNLLNRVIINQLRVVRQNTCINREVINYFFLLWMVASFLTSGYCHYFLIFHPEIVCSRRSG